MAMNFLKLTQLAGGKPIWVNMDHVVSVAKGTSATRIVTVGGTNIDVTEAVEYVIAFTQGMSAFHKVKDNPVT